MQEPSATTRSTRHHDFQSPRCGCRLRLYDDTAARCPMAANYVVPAEMSRWTSRRPPIRSSATVKTNDLSSCRRVKTALKRPAAHTETQVRLPRAVSPWPGHGVTGSSRVARSPRCEAAVLAGRQQRSIHKSSCTRFEACGCKGTSCAMLAWDPAFPARASAHDRPKRGPVCLVYRESTKQRWWHSKRACSAVDRCHL